MNDIVEWCAREWGYQHGMILWYDMSLGKDDNVEWCSIGSEWHCRMMCHWVKKILWDNLPGDKDEIVKLYVSGWRYCRMLLKKRLSSHLSRSSGKVILWMVLKIKHLQCSSSENDSQNFSEFKDSNNSEVPHQLVIYILYLFISSTTMFELDCF